MVTAIVLSGGCGSRLGASVPKQYLEVNGKPIIYYCLKTFVECEAISSIRVVAATEWQDYILKYIEELGGEAKFQGFSVPGDNRQKSILNALEDAKNMKYVLLHDAARPFLKQELIYSMIESIKSANGVLPVLPMKDTVYFSEDGKSITSLLDRSKVLAGQAPELFDYSLYYDANKKLSREELLKINGSTEPAILAGMKINFVNGDESNFKITTVEDLDRAKQILESGVQS